jgi:molecular chaperone GrpE
MTEESVSSNNGQESEKVVTAEDMAEALPEEEVETTAAGEETVEAEPEQEETATVATEDEAVIDEEPSLEEKLAAAEAQAAEYLEGWQRARAEFANARKRLEKSRIEARRNATVDVVGKLLPILDDFTRALDNVPDHVAEDSWFEGVALVHRKLQGILEEAGIEPIEAVGAPFDPNYHEAVMQEESDEYESGIIIKELQKGYHLGERVIRPAMVVVAA